MLIVDVFCLCLARVAVGGPAYCLSGTGKTFTGVAIFSLQMFEAAVFFVGSFARWPSEVLVVFDDAQCQHDAASASTDFRACSFAGVLESEETLSIS